MVRNVGTTRSLNMAVTEAFGTVAAWTLSYASGNFAYTCDTTDEVGVVALPIEIPLVNDANGVGSAAINTVEMSYTIGTAALDAAPTAAIKLVAKAVDGAAPVVTSVACTVVAGGSITDTKTVDDHLITITPDTDVDLSGSENIILEVSFDKAATSTVALTGCTANYNPLIG